VEATNEQKDGKNRDFGPLMPNQPRYAVIGIPSSMFMSAAGGSSKLFVGFQIEYTYANEKSGIFGAIMYVDFAMNNTESIEEWV
jgi:hypothetical protein